MVKSIFKYSILGLSGFAAVLIIALYGQAAIQGITGLAVAQNAATWNNLKDASAGDNITNGIGAFNLFLYDGTNFDRSRGDITNGLDVDVTRVQGTVTIAGANTPSDAFANPTNAVPAQTFNEIWNGATWDRIRSVAVGNNASTGLLAVGLYGYDGATFDRLTITGTSLNVNCTGGCAGGGSNTPSDAFANPTDASPTQDFLMVYNGATWDLVREGTFGGGITIGSFAAGSLKTQTALYGYDQVFGGFQQIDVDQFASAPNRYGISTRIFGATSSPITSSNMTSDGIVLTPGLSTAAGLHGYNGATWDRLRSGGNDTSLISQSSTGNLNSRSFLYGFDGGTDWTRIQSRNSNFDDVTPTLASLAVISTLYGYDNVGNNLDRLISNRSDIDGVPTKSNGILETGSKIFGFSDATLGWGRIRTSGNDGDAQATIANYGLLYAKSHSYGFNGTTWDRLRTTDVGATATTGILAQGLYAWAGGTESVGATWVRLHAGNFGADGNSNNFVQLATASFNLGFNGTTWDRVPITVSNASNNITTNTSTLVKASRGTINRLHINAAGATSTASLYNDSTVPCNTGFVETIDTSIVNADVEVGHEFTTGICVLTAGAVAADISVLHR